VNQYSFAVCYTFMLLKHTSELMLLHHMCTNLASSHKCFYTSSCQCASCHMLLMISCWYIYFAPRMGAMYCYQLVCLSVCLHIQTSRNFLCCLWPMAQSSSDDNVVCYALPVLWMTLCFHIMGQIRAEAWSLQCNELFRWCH